jgi:hypothetical protein
MRARECRTKAGDRPTVIHFLLPPDQEWQASVHAVDKDFHQHLGPSKLVSLTSSVLAAELSRRDFHRSPKRDAHVLFVLKTGAPGDLAEREVRFDQ